MYVGTHYNSYYSTLFGNKGSVYGGFNSGKVDNPYLNSLLNAGTTTGSGKNNIFSPVSSKGLQYVFDLKDGSSGLSASLASLSSGSAFGKTAVVSSDREAMTVTGGFGAFSFGSFPQISVRIDQIAKGQINTGTAMQADEKSSLTGTQRFSVEVGGRSYELSVNASAGDTNKDIQQKMAAAINSANVGVKATVLTDDKTKTSVLQLSAAGTGENEKSMFTLKDVSGNAVAATGAANTEQQAQNALFSINGGTAQSSQSNTVNLGNGVTATLKKAGTDPVTVSRGPDMSFAESKVNEFVDNYNKLYGAALENANDPKAARLLSRLVSTSKIYASKLAGAGIEFDGKGYMKINEEQFKTASENGKLEQFFTENRNANYGFTNQISRIARQVQTNTAGYVSRSTLTDSSANPAKDLLSSFSDYNYMGNSFSANIRNFIRGTGIFESSGLLFDMLL